MKNAEIDRALKMIAVARQPKSAMADPMIDPQGRIDILADVTEILLRQLLVVAAAQEKN